MVAKDGLVTVNVASRSMGKARVKGEIECNGLEADVGVIVLLADSCNYIVIKLLELDSFSKAGEE